MVEQVLLDLPFRGRWQARNSPDRHVPSHGTDMFGVTYAIDFVAVDERERSAPLSWQRFLWNEPPDIFRGFGAPVLAPASGTVVVAHDGERDHMARRSPIVRILYAIAQGQRVREGVNAIAGNHVVISIGSSGPFVTLAHLRRDTLAVAMGDQVSAGDQVGECGNSGNSTEPHVHVQATDSTQWRIARGLPIAFHRSRGAGADRSDAWIPSESEIVRGGSRRESSR